MKKNKVTVVKGHGRIAGKGKVEVTGEDGGKQTLETKNIIIATGSVPKSLPNVPVDHKRVLNSRLDPRSSTEDPQEPDRARRRRGGLRVRLDLQPRAAARSPSSSTCRNLLPIEDEDARKELEKHFKPPRKIELHTGAKVEKVGAHRQRREGHHDQWAARRRRSRPRCCCPRWAARR